MGTKKKILQKKKKSRQKFFSQKKILDFFQNFRDFRFWDFFKILKIFNFFQILRFWDFFSHFQIFEDFFLRFFSKNYSIFRILIFFWDFSIFHYFTIFNTNSLKITENTQKIELNRFRVLRTPLDNYLRSYERLKTTHIPNSIPRSHPQGLLLLIVLCVRVDVRCASQKCSSNNFKISESLNYIPNGF